MIAPTRKRSPEITSALIEGLERTFATSMQKDIFLTSRTTFRCKAKADVVVSPQDKDALIRLVAILLEHDLRWGLDWCVMGRGSNVLIRDGGFPGVIIDLSEGFSSIADVRENDDHVFIRAEAGVPNGTLLHWLKEHELGGFGWSYGIPGTVGGGIRMNAGTPLGCFGQSVRNVEGVSIKGDDVEFEVTEDDFEYRNFPKGKDLIITAGILFFSRSTKKEIEKEVEFARKRRANQPLDMPNIGSVFKNPEGNYAARLIEAAGLKGLRIGDAEISPKHANFIVNRGDARTQDVLELIDHAKRIVRERFEVELEPEVQVIGVDA